jgi:hypothetical protein
MTSLISYLRDKWKRFNDWCGEEPEDGCWP